jgi:hypothetical protein
LRTTFFISISGQPQQLELAGAQGFAGSLQSPLLGWQTIDSTQRYSVS